MEHECKSMEVLTKTERHTCVCVSYLRPGRRRPTAAPQLSAASSAAGCSAGRTQSSCRRSRSLARLGALQLVAVSAGVPEFFCSLLDFSSVCLSLCLCLFTSLSLSLCVRPAGSKLCLICSNSSPRTLYKHAPPPSLSAHAYRTCPLIG